MSERSGMDPIPAELVAFAQMSREEATNWLAARQEENRLARLAECEANGAHVLASGETACPNCGTPYNEVFDWS